MSKYRPLGSRILIQRIEPEQKTSFGLILLATPKSQEGRVIAVGPGEAHPIAVSVGDRILFKNVTGTDIKLDGQDYLVIKEDDVQGVFED